MCFDRHAKKPQNNWTAGVHVALTLGIVSASSWVTVHILPFKLWKQTTWLHCRPLRGWLICSSCLADGFGFIKFAFFSLLQISYGRVKNKHSGHFCPTGLASFFSFWIVPCGLLHRPVPPLHVCVLSVSQCTGAAQGVQQGVLGL